MKIALLGYGVVGKSVVELVKQISDIEIKYILVRKNRECLLASMVDDIDIIINDDDIDVVVECIGGASDAYNYVLKALANGKHVVTSNKEMMAKHYIELINCANQNGVNIKFEAACGGSIMWFQSIERIINIDSIVSFKGIVNGTCNYILSNMVKDGASFNQVLKKAQQLGFAELDPSFDIKGIDSQFKCCLSANYCFKGVFDYQTIPCFGIENICAKEINYAIKNQAIIKLMVYGYQIDKQYCLFVLPMMLKNTDLMANVCGSLNCLSFDTALLKSSSFTGHGAGGIPTAFAIVENLMNIHSKVDHQLDTLNNNLDLIKMTYYIRSSKIKNIDQYINTYIDNETIITKDLSLRELCQIKALINDESCFVMGVQ